MTSSGDDGRPQSGAAVTQLHSIADDRDDLPDNVTRLPIGGRAEHLRIVEALLFAASEPLDEESMAARLPKGAEIGPLLRDLQSFYAGRGVNLVRVAEKWTFRTADDLAFLMRREAVEQKRLSRAALETLSIIAYHQPVTRAEIEEVRGVAVNKGTLDVLMQAGWIRVKGRRQAPGRPVTFATTDAFLSHFGLESIKDLPGLSELKAAGLLSSDIPEGFGAEESEAAESESDEDATEDETFEEVSGEPDDDFDGEPDDGPDDDDDREEDGDDLDGLDHGDRA